MNPHVHAREVRKRLMGTPPRPVRGLVEIPPPELEPPIPELPRANPVVFVPCSVRAIMEATSEVTGVSIDRMCGVGRQKRDALPRQIVMHLGVELAQQSFSSIGRRLGGRDHNTISHGDQKIRSLLAVGDAWTVAVVAAVKAIVAPEKVSE